MHFLLEWLSYRYLDGHFCFGSKCNICASFQDQSVTPMLGTDYSIIPHLQDTVLPINKYILNNFS